MAGVLTDRRPGSPYQSWFAGPSRNCAQTPGEICARDPLALRHGAKLPGGAEGSVLGRHVDAVPYSAPRHCTARAKCNVGATLASSAQLLVYRRSGGSLAAFALSTPSFASAHRTMVQQTAATAGASAHSRLHWTRQPDAKELLVSQAQQQNCARHVRCRAGGRGPRIPEAGQILLGHLEAHQGRATSAGL